MPSAETLLPRARILALCEKHGNRPDALIEILHDIQHEAGHVPESVIPELAGALNRSRAEISGVISFYHDFRRTPGGRHTIRICAAEACQAMQGRAVLAAAERLLGIRAGETTSDGSVSLDVVYCLGLCAASPAMLVDGAPKVRVEPAALQTLIAELVQ